MKKVFLLFLLATIVSIFACKGAGTNTPTSNATPSPQTQSQPPRAQFTPVSGPSIIARAEPAPSPKNLPAEKTFSDLVMLYGQLFTARAKNNTVTVNELLASDYAETAADGQVLSKAQVLATMKPGQKGDTFSLSDMNSSASGDNGTVTGRASVTRNGKKEVWKFNVTFRKENGKWLATSTKISDYKKE